MLGWVLVDRHLYQTYNQVSDSVYKDITSLGPRYFSILTMAEVLGAILGRYRVVIDRVLFNI